MTSSLDPSLVAPTSFVPYTVFPAVEQVLEQHLGRTSKVLLPPQQQAGFVRALPWVALVFLPLHFAGVTLLLGFHVLGSVFGSGAWLPALLSTAVFALDLAALPGLFKRTRRGWAFFTYALLGGAFGNLISLSIFGLLISAALLWIAFQVKYRYA